MRQLLSRLTKRGSNTLERVRVERRWTSIYVVHNDRGVFGMRWQIAEALARTLRGQQSIYDIAPIRVDRHALSVDLIYRGELVVTMPLWVAEALSKQLVAEAREAETRERYENRATREALEEDQRILLENNIPINLGVPRSELPKLGPAPVINGIRCTETFGRPTLVQHQPTREQRAAHAAAVGEVTDGHVAA